MKFTESLEYLERAKKVIPCQTQTFSKGPNYFPQGASPVYAEMGYGSHLWDVDYNEYVDFILGLGPITLGYNYPATNTAIVKQLRLGGITFSLPHLLEVELSELLVDIIPCAEMVRFSKTGSEVTSAATKIARAYTGRDHIAFRGYHGWHDWYSVTTERSKGIPGIYNRYIHQFEYNNIKSLEAIFAMYPDQVACVIMEPMIVEEPALGFLETVKMLAHQKGALLIFDEIVTGFRWSLGGAQEYFGVTPDLATFGKGIANGMPLSAVVGRADIMKECEEIFFSTTFGGECLSLAAGISTIKEMREKKTIDHCWSMGKRLMGGLTDLGVKVSGYPCRPAITDEYLLKPETKTLLIQELIKRRILLHSGLLINLCYSHTEEDIDKMLNAFEEVLRGIKENRFELEGSLIQPSFKRL